MPGKKLYVCQRCGQRCAGKSDFHLLHGPLSLCQVPDSLQGVFEIDRAEYDRVGVRGVAPTQTVDGEPIYSGWVDPPISDEYNVRIPRVRTFRYIMIAFVILMLMMLMVSVNFLLKK